MMYTLSPALLQKQVPPACTSTANDLPGYCSNAILVPVLLQVSDSSLTITDELCRVPDHFTRYTQKLIAIVLPQVTMCNMLIYETLAN